MSCVRAPQLSRADRLASLEGDATNLVESPHPQVARAVASLPRAAAGRDQRGRRQAARRNAAPLVAPRLVAAPLVAAPLVAAPLVAAPRIVAPRIATPRIAAPQAVLLGTEDAARAFAPVRRRVGLSTRPSVAACGGADISIVCSCEYGYTHSVHVNDLARD
jgi:hypothetical protein